MKLRLAVLVVVLVAVLLPLPVLAQTPIWRAYSNGNWVNGLASDGAYLWAATAGGVVRWSLSEDASTHTFSYTKYTTSAGLADNRTYAVAIGADGSKWFGTASGISRLQGSTWTTYTRVTQGNSRLYLDEVRDLVVDSSGTVWAAFVYGVARFDGDAEWVMVTDAGGNRLPQAQAMAFDGPDLWLATLSHGVVKLSGSSVTSYNDAGSWVDSVAVDTAGNKWFVAQTGVYRYDGATWSTFTSANTGGAVHEGQVETVAADDHGKVWFGGGGVTSYDGSTWVWYTAADGLVSNDVRSFAFGAVGAVWCGTRSNGIARLASDTWADFAIADEQPPGNEVKAVAVDNSGAKWFGTNAGAVRFDGATWEAFYPGEEVGAVYVDASGDVWLGTSSGTGNSIRMYDGSAWTTYTTADGIIDSEVLAIRQDSAGVLWFGTGDGVSRLESGAWSAVTVASGLANNHVLDIFEDGSGNLWFATGGSGVSRLAADRITWTTFDPANSGLAYDWVYAVAQDGDGAIWFGHGAGMSRLSDGVWTSYDSNDGLGQMGSAGVKGIAIDGEGMLWLAGFGGLSRYDGRFTVYGTGDGLACLEVNALAIDGDGHLWLGTEGGISEITSLPRDVYTFVPMVQ